MNASSLRLASFNLSCLHNRQKAMLSKAITREKLNIINIQETHPSKENQEEVRRLRNFIYPCKVFCSFNNGTDNYGGVCTIIRGTKYKYLNFEELIQLVVLQISKWRLIGKSIIL